MSSGKLFEGISRRLEVWLLLLPAAVWLVLFKDFLTGRIILNVDSNANYALFKYTFNSIFNGAVPLWNPYIHGGVANVLLTSAGFLNPLVILLSLLHYVGLNYYQIYLLYLVSYYFIGLWGFYLLARRIFPHIFDALLAYWLVLFSGMGAMLFTQIYLLQIFVTAVWFFYFLLGFAQRFSKVDLAGMTFAAIILLYSYLPPYFMTLFWMFAVLWGCLFPHAAAMFFTRSADFMRRKKGPVCLCVLLFVLAAVFFFIPQQGSRSDDLFFVARQDGITDSMEKMQSAKMGLTQAGLKGTLGERMTGARALSHLDKYPYTEDSFVYLPVVVYILVLLSFFTDFDRRRALLLFLAAAIFLLSLGLAYPLHPFLFSKIPYFQLFRNLFLFIALLIPLVVLFAVSQWRAMLEFPLKGIRYQKIAIGISTAVHLTLAGWMYAQGDILISSYLTVGLSWGFSLLAIRQVVPRSGALLAGIVLLICVVEPIEVFTHYRINAERFYCQLPTEHVLPRFSYIRGEDFAEEKCPLYSVRSYQEYWPGMVMQDSSGVPGHHPLVVSKWLFILWQNMDEDILRQYMRYKFWLYDNVRYFEKTKDEAVFIESLKAKANVAFIFGEPPAESASASIAGQAGTADGDSEQFKVQAFTPNEVVLSTGFAQKKFLVYTDAYHKDWKVFINGRQEKLYRANAAFKGVWLPAGENKIIFRYRPAGATAVYLAAFGVQIAALGYLCHCYWRRRKEKQNG